MDQLSNAFSVLEVDVEDSREQTRENGDGEASEQKPRPFVKPLVWIDLEMTGLNIDIDRIVEIAIIITDGKLARSIEGPDLVINQPKELMDNMGEWCQVHHKASGLTERVLQSTISEQEAEKKVLEFIKKHLDVTKPLIIAGNSVYTDLIFIRKYMQELGDLFSHNVVDVSSLKQICLRWYPTEDKKAPKKDKNHRAMDDIRESIAELKYYKESIFKSTKSKR